jgi:hypothetical protein
MFQAIRNKIVELSINGWINAAKMDGQRDAFGRMVDTRKRSMDALRLEWRSKKRRNPKLTIDEWLKPYRSQLRFARLMKVLCITDKSFENIAKGIDKPR